MPLNLASPGIVVREVDLTIGRVDTASDKRGAIVAPFAKGPVNEPTIVESEQDLLDNFGEPYSTDKHFEHWMVASSFLAYGGSLNVVRADDASFANGKVGSASSIKIKSLDHYNDLGYDGSTITGVTVAARNPGSWANNLKVAIIDDLADQSIGIGTTNPLNLGIQVGYAVTTDINSSTVAGVGTVTSFSGHLKGIITGVTTDATNGESSFLVKITDRVSAAGTETDITYVEYDEMNSFQADDVLYFVNNSGINTGTTGTATSVTDWYNAQTLGLTNSTVYWSQLAPIPITNQYCSDRNSKNDAIHVVVVDDSGSVSGVRGNILEKNISLSKAGDAISAVNSPLKIYYKDFLANNSQNIYSGANVSSAEDAYWNTIPRATGFSTTYTANTTAEGLWGQEAQGVTFAGIGNVSYTLTSGKDYSTEGSGMTATLGALSTAYDLFANKDEIDVDFLIMGPGLSYSAESQAKANKLIAIAEDRKDCVAVASPHRANVVNVTNTTTQTNNVIQFFSPLSSSSYAVFDSGYKYTYDRFNNKFRYIPCNGDIAGLMVRTDIEQFPWYSPAGQQRGILNNAIKLAYNPNKNQRDLLYEARVNSIINQPGTGVLLFGDKTGLAYASAFDRINVRRLFLTIEQALENVAQAQLFEFNDQITRSNFVNVVEPYLRDVQAKRGIHDFRVICDGTNNTPAVIDNNEFRADIFIKPNKAINYVTLTFVATRTGVSFEEVTGTV